MQHLDQNIFRFPPPYSGANFPRSNTTQAEAFSPQGMLMPSQFQAPPMYGPRGSTIPPRFLGHYGKKPEQPNRRHNFFCEPCNRGFDQKSHLDKHIGEHQQCGIDGCQFTGHPAIVSKHIEQQHVTGLYDKLKNLDKPEEIAKWREERKRRYPTKSNVELRQKLQEEKLKRGERVGDRKSRFGRRDDRNKCRDQNAGSSKAKRQRKRRRNRNRMEGGQEDSADKKKNEPDTNEEEDGIPRFRGTAGLTDYWRPKPKEEKTNALSSLAGLYGSDSEIESDNENSAQLECCKINVFPDPEITDESELSTVEDERPCEPSEDKLDTSGTQAVFSPELETSPLEQNQIENSSPPKSPPVCPDDDDSDVQEEIPFVKVVENLQPDERTEPNNEDKPIENAEVGTKSGNGKRTQRNGVSAGRRGASKPARKYGLNYSRMYRRRQNTMLEKLLQPDIIHERNVLLQCVRYVVQNNFFGIGQAKRD